jgi:hypothetical protein
MESIKFTTALTASLCLTFIPLVLWQVFSERVYYQ